MAIKDTVITPNYSIFIYGLYIDHVLKCMSSLQPFTGVRRITGQHMACVSFDSGANMIPEPNICEH